MSSENKLKYCKDCGTVVYTLKRTCEQRSRHRVEELCAGTLEELKL